MRYEAKNPSRLPEGWSGKPDPNAARGMPKSFLLNIYANNSVESKKPPKKGAVK